jgi:CheY-like chemotaxis protein
MIAGGSFLIRLAEERRECERRLEQLTADIASVTEDEQRAQAAAQRLEEEKARFIARIRPELLTPLHTVLGYAQLVRMEGGLDAMQSLRLGAVLAAGTHVLERVQALLEIHAGGFDQTQWPGEASGEGPGEEAAERPAPESQANGLPALAQAARKLHVLVVDDAEINRDIAASFLRAAGHAVTLAESGIRGVAEAATGVDFDVILMDVRMPGMDGLEASRRIRALGGKPGQVPIVALSAVARPDQIEACRAAGMNGHLGKPFTPATLVAASERAAALFIGSTAPPNPWHAGGGRAGGHSRSGYAPESQDGAELPWIDVAGTWEAKPPRRSPVPPAAAASGANDTFVIRIRALGPGRVHRQADAVSSCQPPPDHQHHEFHWLVYVDPAFDQEPTVHAACDLWRWHRSTWVSTTVPGARFSSMEMHDQGWRYCGPCPDRMARVEIQSGGRLERLHEG